MPCSPALVALDTPVKSEGVSIQELIRTLVELSENGRATSGKEGGDSSEEILVGFEVDSSRYLLVRMPKLNPRRIQLSPREQEIVRMVAKGHPNKVIADVLSISSWTVCTHLRRIFAKLGVGSRAAMVAQLLDLGILAKEHHGSMGARHEAN